MTEPHLLGPYIRRFLLEHIVADRCLMMNVKHFSCLTTIKIPGCVR
jgi:hypothetical protein